MSHYPICNCCKKNKFDCLKSQITLLQAEHNDLKKLYEHERQQHHFYLENDFKTLKETNLQKEIKELKNTLTLRNKEIDEMTGIIQRSTSRLRKIEDTVKNLCRGY
jgi:hypothetical protein